MRWLLLLVLLASCRVPDEAGSKSDRSVGVWTDPLTGCQYLKLYGSGITPRLDRDGKPVCP